VGAVRLLVDDRLQLPDLRAHVLPLYLVAAVAVSQFLLQLFDLHPHLPYLELLSSQLFPQLLHFLTLTRALLIALLLRYSPILFDLVLFLLQQFARVLLGLLQLDVLPAEGLAFLFDSLELLAFPLSVL
jgi:hypothetical protein